MKSHILYIKIILILCNTSRKSHLKVLNSYIWQGPVTVRLHLEQSVIVVHDTKLLHHLQYTVYQNVS